MKYLYNFPQGLKSPLIAEDPGTEKELKLRFDVSQYSPEEIMVGIVQYSQYSTAQAEQYSTVQYSIVQYSTVQSVQSVQYSTVSTVQYSQYSPEEIMVGIVQYSQYSTVSTVQYSTV